MTTRGAPVADRIAELSPHARQLSAVASVFGATFSIDDAGEVLGEPVGRLIPWVREIVDAGIVVAEQQAFAFVDDATREAIYASIPEPVRLPLHREIGSPFLARGGSTLAAAGHLANAARPGDRATLRALDRASTEALAGHPECAADFALRAFDLTAADDEHQADRVVAAVRALVAARRLLDAATLIDAILDHVQLPGAAVAELRVTLCSILTLTGRANDALRHAEAALATPDLPAPWHVAAETERLIALLAHDIPAAARAPAEAILADPDRPGDDDALACALTALAWIAWDEGRIADALGLMRAAVHRSDCAPVASRRWSPRLFLAPMLIAIGEVEEAHECIDAVDRELAIGHVTPWTVTPLIFRARLQVETGAIDAAHANAKLALATAETQAARSLFSPLLATLTYIALLRDGLDAASEYLGRFGALGLAQGGFLSRGSYAWVEARVRERQDGPTRALETLLPAVDDLGAHKRLFLDEPGSAAWLVRIALAAGDHWRAAAIVAAVEQLAADNCEFPDIHARAVHARAVLDGDVVALRWAAANQRQLWARALATDDAASALDAAGRDDEAQDMMERAIVAYEQAGARCDADRLRRRVEMPSARAHRRCGSRDRPVEGWDSLSEGEGRIVALVAEGLTNRQVAARAFLSRHTVDFHLRHIFRKLNVSSRVEVARISVEHGHPRSVTT